MNEPLLVKRESYIAAPPATVFAYLTDPEKIVAWMGAEAESDPRPGGLYLLKGISERRGTLRGSFREVVPVHRLAYAIGWDHSAEVPPGSSLVEIDLSEHNGGTLMRMTHSGLPSAEECRNHEIGWTHYLARMKLAAEGGDPGPDRGVRNPET